jgi:hypothetical protein
MLNWFHPGALRDGMDRFTSMAVFKRTVEAGSFASAARHFGISAEMAGNHVRALEQHLGVRLLNRTKRHLHLTDAGSSFYRGSGERSNLSSGYAAWPVTDRCASYLGHQASSAGR